MDQCAICKSAEGNLFFDGELNRKVHLECVPSHIREELVAVDEFILNQK